MWLWALLPVLVALSCAPAARPPETTSAASAPGAASAPSVPQRPLVIGFATEPISMEPSFGQGSGNRDFSALTSGFLAYLTPQQQARPFLAEELPTVENGAWKVLPDGRMETTYRLRKNATWHDGKPVTANDFVFAFRVHLDPAMPVTKIDVDRRMETVRALDDQTLFIEWKEPYLWAGMVHPPNFSPLPRHLVEDMYLNNKAAFVDGPHWREGWVGSGPYRIERWEPGSEMLLRAHSGFALGKPIIDQITMKFITDANTIVANLLSGAVDAAFHSSVGFPQNRELEQLGWSGATQYWRGNPRWIEFQQRDWGNLQKAALDARVRRGLMHAIDRGAIVDNLYAGKTNVQHFWLSVDDPAYPAVDRAAMKYDYDPSRAQVLLAEAGWIRASDGMVRNATGEQLVMPMLNQSADVDQLEAAVVADNWRSVGVAMDLQRLSRQNQADGEFRTKFAGAAYERRPLGYETMSWLTTSVTSPETRWSGDNRIGYVNPVLDQTWPRVLATIDAKQREDLLVEAIRAMSADAVVNPTHLQPRAMAFRDGLAGPQETWVGESALIWNAWEWQWK